MRLVPICVKLNVPQNLGSYCVVVARHYTAQYEWHAHMNSWKN